MNSNSDNSSSSRCGFIALVGRPNVGKSTLLNHLLKQKISITSRKPQTTRHRILGINTTTDTQYVYVDTPGLHADRTKALNRIMNETVEQVIRDVDVVLFVVDRANWTDGDELVMQALSRCSVPVILVINKCDLLKDKTKLLPFMDKMAKRESLAEIVPVSALKGQYLESIEQVVKQYLPRGEFLYPSDQVTDRSTRFITAEIVREKITRQVGDELPYDVAVEVEKFSDEGKLITIEVLILIDKEGQKQILIGKNGARLKSIGTAARIDLERFLEKKIMLNLWVKVKSGWADNARAIKSLGYTDNG